MKRLACVEADLWCRALPVFGHRQMLHQREPASAEAQQGGDAVVIQVQLSEEDLVGEPGRLVDEARGQTNSRRSSLLHHCQLL